MQEKQMVVGSQFSKGHNNLLRHSGYCWWRQSKSRHSSVTLNVMYNGVHIMGTQRSNILTSIAARDFAVDCPLGVGIWLFNSTFSRKVLDDVDAPSSKSAIDESETSVETTDTLSPFDVLSVKISWSENRAGQEEVITSEGIVIMSDSSSSSCKECRTSTPTGDDLDDCDLLVPWLCDFIELWRIELIFDTTKWRGKNDRCTVEWTNRENVCDICPMNNNKEEQYKERLVMRKRDVSVVVKLDYLQQCVRCNEIQSLINVETIECRQWE